jgi:predicted Zn-dependent protease
VPEPLENFLAMLAQGRDSALLRYSLGNEYIKRGNPEKAAEHLRQAVAFDPRYSAAWKLLGKALAEANGDKQVAREMGVFARRIEKQMAQNPAEPG